MVCENCKERQANLTVTQVHNGQKVAHHYCEICASKFHPFQFELQDEPISLQQFITNWFGNSMKPSMQEHSTSARHTTCTHCKLPYSKFLKVGKFGCAYCYSSFAHLLPPILEKLQASTQHVSTQEPSNEVNRIEAEITMLRNDMQEAILEERFEDAAKLRDEIKNKQKTVSSRGDSQ